MTPLFCGFGPAVLGRIGVAAGRHPSLLWTVFVTGAGMVTAPIGFRAGLGAFDYWLRYAVGAPTIPEDHSGHGARSWRSYFRVNTDHKVIGIQYVSSTIIFFLVGGLLAMLVRAELARPGMQYVD